MRPPRILAVLLALAPLPAIAQEPAAEPVDRWKITAELGLNTSSGNTDLTVFSTGIDIERLETDRYELGWTLAFRYGESEGEVVARHMKTGFSFDLHPEALWSPFVFVEAERDPFRRLDLRTSSGGGVKYVLSRSERGELSLSAAALHSYESFTDGDAATVPDSRSVARWSLRARGSREFRPGARLEHTTWFRPVWDRTDDYDIEASTKLTVLLSERVGLSLSHLYRRDSTPPPDVEPDDTQLQAGLTLAF